LKLTDQQYTYILSEHTGKFSSADPAFTDDDFKKIMDHFKLVLGFQVKRKWEQERPRNANDLPTKHQLRMIEHLWHDFAHSHPDAYKVEFQRGFYEKALRIPRLGPQTCAQANRVIEALKNRVQRVMQTRDMHKGHAPHPCPP
jgi:hypothetical protein